MTYLYEELLAPTRLYIKQCPHCGMKYFGKSKRADIEKYTGSGTDWKKHLDKHRVEPIHLWNSDWYYDTSISRFALKFSRINKIVVSDKWANLIEENGLDGGWDLVNASGKNLYGKNGRTPNISDNFKRGLETFRKNLQDEEWRMNYKRNVSSGLKQWHQENENPFKGKTHSEETRRCIGEQSKIHQSGAGNSQHGTKWIYSLKEKVSKKIEKDHPIPPGWFEGRKMKFN